MAVQSDYRYSLTVNGATQFEVVRFVLKEHYLHSSDLNSISQALVLNRIFIL